VVLLPRACPPGRARIPVDLPVERPRRRRPDAPRASPVAGDLCRRHPV